MTVRVSRAVDHALGFHHETSAYHRQMIPTIRPRDVDETAKLVYRVTNWLQRSFRADHRAILGLSTRADHGMTGGYYVIVAVAPSRHVRPRSPSALACVAMKLAAMVPQLQMSPARSGLDTFRFEGRDTENNLEVAFEVRSSGLVVLLWRVAPPPLEDMGPDLHVIDLLDPIRIVCTIANSDALSLLVREHRKADWHIGLTPVAMTSVGAIQWERLLFPGRHPDGRATEARPSCPVLGFAGAELRSIPRKQSARRIIGPMLSDLLAESGYFGNDHAVADIRRSFDEQASRC